MRPRPFAGARGKQKVWSAGSKRHYAALRLAPGVRLSYGVRPAKSKRRQRTTAATASQATSPGTTTSAGKGQRHSGAAAPGTAGLRVTAGNGPHFHAVAASPQGQQDSVLSAQHHLQRHSPQLSCQVTGIAALNREQHAAEACASPFRAGRDRSPPAGYPPTTYRITVMRSRVLGERPPTRRYG